jgi:hypothetical protein
MTIPTEAAFLMRIVIAPRQIFSVNRMKYLPDLRAAIKFGFNVRGGDASEPA